MSVVEQRCIERFGVRKGMLYFEGLIGTLPDRRPDLFPELEGFE